MSHFSNKVSIILILFSCLSIISCVPSETTDVAPVKNNDDSTLNTAAFFPEKLAITSPFEFQTDTIFKRSLRERSSATVSKYSWTTARIEMLLKGDTPSMCRFDPEMFLTLSRTASCYGPAVSYQGHPDAPSAGDENGQLPSGDLGIWLADEADSGKACSAAELTARLEGIRERSMASLMGLSSMICVIGSNGLTMPESESLSLTYEMNALNIADTVFSSVTITHSNDPSGNSIYSYSMEFDYTTLDDSHSIIVNMEHRSGASNGKYSGFITTQVNDRSSGGNCSSSEITHNSSLHYKRDSDRQIRTEVREAQFCGHDISGLNSDAKVDPTEKFNGYNSGWGNNFAIFTADFDPFTLSGNYAYTWQAGPDDGNSRSFNIVTDFSKGSGHAFYGYSDDIADTDGNITGFICNWAGPGSDRSTRDYVQYQKLELNPETGSVTASESNISYAPTNSCSYDGMGDFSYDSDIDGAIDTDATTAITPELLATTDSDGDGVFDEISKAGFTLPSI